MVGRAAETGKTVSAQDVANESSFIPLEGSRFESHALMCLPLREKGEVLGVLNLGNPEARLFQVESEHLLEMAAQRIAGLLSMHTLHSKLRDSETRCRLVAEHAGDGILVFDIALNFAHGLGGAEGLAAAADILIRTRRETGKPVAVVMYSRAIGEDDIVFEEVRRSLRSRLLAGDVLVYPSMPRALRAISLVNS